MTSTPEPTAPRRTRQRAAVGDQLQRVAEFRTAQQIHDDLRQLGTPVGLTTVYRNLQAMAESGEVDVIRTGEGEQAYRHCNTSQHHHHLVCRSCGTTVEVDAPDVERWADETAREHGFRDISHEFEIFGLCAACPNEPPTGTA